MANVLIYNEETGAAIRYKVSVNTPDYTERTDVLINPDVSGLQASEIPLSDWKVDAGIVRELTQQEKDDRAAAQAAAAAQAVLDQIAYSRTQAKSYVDSGLSDIGLIIRALAVTIKDEINILRSEHSLAARTNAQLKTAIQNKIDDESADNMD